MRGGLWGGGHAHSSTPPVNAATISHVKQGGHLPPGMASTQEAAGCWGGGVGRDCPRGHRGQCQGQSGEGESAHPFLWGHLLTPRLLSTQPITPTLGRPARRWAPSQPKPSAALGTPLVILPGYPVNMFTQVLCVCHSGRCESVSVASRSVPPPCPAHSQGLHSQAGCDVTAPCAVFVQ